MIDFDRINAQLAVLTRAYVDEMPERLAVMSGALARLSEEGDARVKAVDDLRHLSHKIVGTGASFGLEELSNAARLIENRCEEILESNAEISAAMAAELHDLFGTLNARAKEAAEATS